MKKSAVLAFVTMSFVTAANASTIGKLNLTCVSKNFPGKYFTVSETYGEINEQDKNGRILNSVDGISFRWTSNHQGSLVFVEDEDKNKVALIRLYRSTTMAFKGDNEMKCKPVK